LDRVGLQRENEGKMNKAMCFAQGGKLSKEGVVLIVIACVEG